MKRNHMSNVTPIFTFTFSLISIVNCQAVSTTLDGLNINVFPQPGAELHFNCGAIRSILHAYMSDCCFLAAEQQILVPSATLLGQNIMRTPCPHFVYLRPV